MAFLDLVPKFPVTLPMLFIYGAKGSGVSIMSHDSREVHLLNIYLLTCVYNFPCMMVIRVIRYTGKAIPHCNLQIQNQGTLEKGAIVSQDTFHHPWGARCVLGSSLLKEVVEGLIERGMWVTWVTQPMEWMNESANHEWMNEKMNEWVRRSHNKIDCLNRIRTRGD